MKFLCIRNYFEDSSSRARWTKGKYYEGREPNELEKSAGIAFYIKSDEIGTKGEHIEHFVKKKDYNMHFKSIVDIRNEKIEEILK